MPKNNGVYFGTFQASLGTVLEEMWPDLPPFTIAMIRAIDSTWDPVQISDWLRQLDISSSVAAGTLIKPVELKLASERGLFTGFDEVWFLNNSASTLAFPERITIALTTDVGPVDTETVNNLVPILESARCHLVLADGTGLGLNCITTKSEFWDTLCTKYAIRQEGKNRKE